MQYCCIVVTTTTEQQTTLHSSSVATLKRFASLLQQWSCAAVVAAVIVCCCYWCTCGERTAAMPEALCVSVVTWRSYIIIQQYRTTYSMYILRSSSLLVADDDWAVCHPRCSIYPPYIPYVWTMNTAVTTPSFQSLFSFARFHLFSGMYSRLLNTKKNFLAFSCAFAPSFCTFSRPFLHNAVI